MRKEVMGKMRRGVLFCLAVAALTGGLATFSRTQDRPSRPVGPEVQEGPEKRDSAEARESPSPSSGPTPGIEAELRTLEAHVKEIEAATDLASEVKAQLLERYRLAMERLRLAADFSSRAATFRRDLTEAPARSKDVRGRLAEAAREPAEAVVIPVTAGTTSKQLEQELAQVQSELQAARTRLTQLESRVEAERKRPTQARDDLTQARQKLDEITRDEMKAPEEGLSRELLRAREVALSARKKHRLAEIDALEQELLSFEPRLELLVAQRDETARDVSALTTRAQAIQEAANRRRLEEAERERTRAEEEQRRARGEHTVVRQLADQTVELGTRLEKIGQKITETTSRTERIKSQKNQIDKDYTTARQRIDKAGLSDVIGPLLRQQRRELPDARDYERESEKRELEISLAELEFYEIEEQLSELGDIEPRTRERLAEVGNTIQDPERAEITDRIRRLLTQKRDLLVKLAESYRTYLVRLGDLDAEQKDLSSTAEKYAHFLDENLLWIRSTGPLGLKTGGDTVAAVRWLALPSNWLETFRAPGRVVTAQPVSTFFLVLLLGALVVAGRRLRRRREIMQPRVGKVQSDSFTLTIEALITDLVTVLPAPLVFGFFAWHTLHDPLSTEFPKAIAAGVWSAATLALALRVFRQFIDTDGVAQLHFRWRQHSLDVLRNRALWLVAWIIVLPAAFLTSVTVTQSEESHRQSLGRLAFIVLMGAIAYLVASTLHPRRGVLAERLQLESEGWLAKLRHLWYPLAVATPLTLLVLAGIGYSYTAFELGGGRLQATITLFLGILLLHNILQRWLYVVHRRMAWEKALEERKARLAAAAATASGEAAADQGEKSAFEVEEPTVDLKQINKQARHLLGTLLGASAIIGLWIIWESVLPAFRVLEEVQLWQYTRTTAEGPSVEWVTLKHVAAAAVIALITAVASRNLPGALELLVLNKLPIDPGGRYAISTISQYLIVGVGVVLAFNALGVGWSHVQWLVAALSVGLGFGLQEIFANFVSGMILLFERPIRVGDIVTIGDVSGVVTRIRMRATTVRNWDRKELVVPNKEFVTGRLLNWTLTDAMNRVVIEVGVAYGSDTERARELLLQVARDHPLILDDPPPIATFEGFGDSSLLLVLRCFLPDLQNRLPAIHELHTAVDQAFRSANIEIAFPQRDLHVRSADSPIRVISEDVPRWTVGSAQDGPSPERQ